MMYATLTLCPAWGSGLPARQPCGAPVGVQDTPSAPGHFGPCNHDMLAFVPTVRHQSSELNERSVVGRSPAQPHPCHAMARQLSRSTEQALSRNEVYISLLSPLVHEQRHLLQALRPARRCHCPVRACSAVVGFIILPQSSSIQLLVVHTRARVSGCNCTRQSYVSFSAKRF